MTAHGCSRCPFWQPHAATGRWHHWILGMPLGPRSSEFRVFEAWVVCVLFGLLQRFATFFEICGFDCWDSTIEICSARQRMYSVLRRGCWGWANHLDVGSSVVTLKVIFWVTAVLASWHPSIFASHALYFGTAGLRGALFRVI